ncbi:MAG: LutC/YkgG family protein [bacterium]
MSKELVLPFTEAAEQVSAKVTLVGSAAEAVQKALAIIAENNGHAVMAWATPLLQSAGLEVAVRGASIAYTSADSSGTLAGWADIEVGITEADYGIAETGSLVLFTGNGRPRLASLLPPVHIALLPISRLLPSLEAFFTNPAITRDLQSFFFVTGPSRTADIEQTLTLGVHGPKSLHIFLIEKA